MPKNAPACCCGFPISSTFRNHRPTFSYDSEGRRESIKRTNNTRTSFTYDANDQTTNVIHRKSDSSVINSFAYSYDGAGNRTSIVEASGDRTTYTYDSTSQLISEHRTGSDAHRTTFTFDAARNRTKSERDAVLTHFDYDHANQLKVQIDAAGRTTFTFDAAGNQQVILEPNGDRTTTTWDYENQPTVYEKPDNSLLTMTYNAENRRTSKETTIGKTKFIWDITSNNLLMETDDFNTTKAVFTNSPVQYGSLISQRRDSSTNWFHFDALGSTNKLTNASEIVTDNYNYDVWGNILSSTGLTINPFQYIGQYGYYYDDENGSSYIRSRVYQPTIARWWSVDPIGFVDGHNLYMYVNNNSTISIDPSGNKTYPAKCCKPGMKCGPDVTKNLMLTLYDAKGLMLSLSWAKRMIAGAKLQAFQTGFSWDIDGLVQMEAWMGIAVHNPCFDDRKGTFCETCAKVGNQMHDMWEINYSLYGLMCSLTGIDFQACRQRVNLWKKYKWVLGEENACRPHWQYTSTLEEWLKFGHEFGGSIASVRHRSLLPKTSNSRFSKCATCFEKGLPIMKFDYHLIKELGKDDTGWPP